MKQNQTNWDGITRLVISIVGITSRFALPRLVPGYHTFGFQIATAALRPRNDKAGGFCLKKGRCFGSETTVYDNKRLFFK